MPLPDEIESALDTYDIEKELFRLAFGDHPAIEALSSLEGDDQTDPFQIISCFVNNTIFEGSATYHVYEAALRWLKRRLELPDEDETLDHVFLFLGNNHIFNRERFDIVLERARFHPVFLDCLIFMNALGDLTAENFDYLKDERNIASSYLEFSKALHRLYHYSDVQVKFLGFSRSVFRRPKFRWDGDLKAIAGHQNPCGVVVGLRRLEKNGSNTLEKREFLLEHTVPDLCALGIILCDKHQIRIEDYREEFLQHKRPHALVMSLGTLRMHGALTPENVALVSDHIAPSSIALQFPIPEEQRSEFVNIGHQFCLRYLETLNQHDFINVFKHDNWCDAAVSVLRFLQYRIHERIDNDDELIMYLRDRLNIPLARAQEFWWITATMSFPEAAARLLINVLGYNNYAETPLSQVTREVVPLRLSATRAVLFHHQPDVWRERLFPELQKAVESYPENAKDCVVKFLQSR